MQNIVTVEFRTEKEAYAVLEQLKQEQETYGYKILQLGLVKKENGVDTPVAGFDIKEGHHVERGGIIGGIIGILGGPLGIAIGAGLGVGTGKTVSKHLKLKNIELMKQAISKLPEDATILLALIDEEEDIVFDNRLKNYKYRTKITHYSVEELEVEMEEAKKAEAEAKKAAAEAKKTAKVKPGQDLKKMETLAKENKLKEKEKELEEKQEKKEEKKQN